MDLNKNLTNLLILFCLLSHALSAQTSSNPAVGKWEGKLQVPQASLRIFFEVKETADGKLKSKMASPDQGANNIPVQSTSWRNDSLVLTVAAVRGEYIAILSKDKKQLDGVWKQGGGEFPLVLKKTEIFQFYPKRPQDPQKPYPYQEEDLIYTNKKVGISLGATLTLPEGKGPFPAVILITGSGAQNRDEEVMGHKPFLIIADYLTRKGIAVLRVDDRGVGKSSGDAKTATSEDNASDVIASLEYLKTRKEIDRKRIGLIGHSEGGMIAPMVASQTADVAFGVLLAGVGVPGDVLYRRQLEDMLRSSGTSEDEIKKTLSVLDRLLVVTKTQKEAPSVAEEFRKILQQEGPAMEAKLKLTAQAMSQPWFRYFLNFDPAPYLQKVKCPILALNGSKDIQVASKENLPAIEKAIKAGGNKNVTVKEIPNLNHFFQTAETGSVAEYAKIEETISPVALQIMSDWIAQVTKSK